MKQRTRTSRREEAGGGSHDPCGAPVKGVQEELLSFPFKSILESKTP